jgi:WD40 repeat protein
MRALHALLLAAFLTLVQERMALTEKGNAPSPADEIGDSLPKGAVARLGSTRFRHPGPVHALTFSPNGELLACASDRAVILWEVATGKPRHRILLPAPSSRALAFSPNGATLTSLGWEQTACDVRVLDVTTGAEVHRFRPARKAEVMHAALSGDGQRIAILWTDGSVSLYDSTGTELPNVGVAKNGPFGFQLALNRDGSRLAGIGGNTGRVLEVGSTVGGSTALEMTPGIGFWRASFSPDGKLLAAPIEPQGGKVESAVWIWDASSGKVRWRLPGSGRAECAVFSPDNKLLATTSNSNPELLIWDVANGTPLHRCRTYDSGGDAAFSPDGKTVAVITGSAAITLWDVASGRMLPVSAEPAAHVVGLRFIFDGKQILGSAAVVHVWGTTTGLEERRFPLLPHFWLPAVQLSPDMTVLATAEDQTIQLWDARSGRALKTITAPRGPIWRLMFSMDGRRVFTCAWDDPVIRVWDVATGAQVQELTGHSTAIFRMTVSPDGRWLASGTIRSRGRVGPEPIRIWDLTTAREVRQFPRPQGIAVALEFSPDSKLLCASLAREEGRDTVIWDVTTGQMRRTLSAEVGMPCCLAFSLDSRMLASGDAAGKLELWELATAERRLELRGHQSMIYSLAFSPDGRLLAASSADAPVFVWDTARTPDSIRASSAEDLKRAWADLAGEDAEAAYRGILVLAAAPGKAEAFLKERAKPLTAPDARRLGELIRDLDSDSFTEREQAASALAKLGRMAEPTLRQALGARATAEAGRQMERLLERLDAPVSDPDIRRTLRAIEALERLGTPAATQVLEGLATGAREALQTREAKASLERLSKRANPASRPGSWHHSRIAGDR